MSADVPVTATLADAVCVALIPKARAAVTAAAARSGLSETDVINRAVQAYDFLEAAAAAGADLRLCWENGDTDRVRFL